MTRNPEKCPLSILNRCPYKAGVRIKRASVERGSTVLQKPFKEELKLTKLLFNIFAASLLYTKCLLKNPAEVL